MSKILDRVRRLEAAVRHIQNNATHGIQYVWAPDNGSRLAFTSAFPTDLAVIEGLLPRLSRAIGEELIEALDDALEQARKDALAEAKAVIAELEPPNAG